MEKFGLTDTSPQREKVNNLNIKFFESENIMEIINNIT